MSDRKSLLINVLVIAGAAFVFGLLIGRISKSSAEPAEASGVSSSQKVKAAKKTPRTKSKSVSNNASSFTGEVTQLEDLFAGVDYSNIAELAKQAAASSNSIENESLLRVLVAQWAKDDPDAAMAFAAGLNRSDLMQGVLHEAGLLQGAAALDLLDKYVTDPNMRGYISTSVYLGIAKNNPQTAMKLVEQLPVGAERDSITHMVMDEWAQQDVQAVFNWIETAEMTPLIHGIYLGTMSKYIKNDPVDASNVIAEMSTCELKTQLAAESARELANVNVTDAINWALKLDAASQKNALYGIMDVWAAGPNPSEALDYLLSNPEYSGYSDLFSSMAVTLSYSHPDDLLNSMDRMNEQDQVVAAERLAIAFSSSEPKRCDELIDSLPAGPVRDAALEPIIDSYRNIDVKRAFDVAQLVSTDFKRLDLMERALLSWAEVDFEGAMLAAQNTDALSGEQKEQLINRVRYNSKSNDYVLP